MSYKNKYDNFSSSRGIIAIIILIIIILGGIFFLGEGTSSQSNQNIPSGEAGQLQISEKVYDFGNISMANGDVEKTFKVTNPTDKDIFIKKITTSCMCTSAYVVKGDLKKGPFGMAGMGYVPPANETIKAGESLDIKVVYDPNAHGPSGVGFIDRFVYLSDANDGKIQLEIKATVTP